MFLVKGFATRNSTTTRKPGMRGQREERSLLWVFGIFSSPRNCSSLRDSQAWIPGFPHLIFLTNARALHYAKTLLKTNCFCEFQYFILRRKLFLVKGFATRNSIFLSYVPDHLPGDPMRGHPQAQDLAVSFLFGRSRWGTWHSNFSLSRHFCSPLSLSSNFQAHCQEQDLPVSYLLFIQFLFTIKGSTANNCWLFTSPLLRNIWAILVASTSRIVKHFHELLIS